MIATLAQLPSAAAETGGAGQVEEAPVLGNTPFDRQGMWVWYVERSEGVSVPAIAARVRPSSRPLSASLPAHANEIRPGPAP